MSETKKGHAPKAGKTGTAGKSGKASETGDTGKTGKRAAGDAVRPLTERQRELKRERDRKYRLRKSVGAACGQVSAGKAPKGGCVCGCGSCHAGGKCSGVAKDELRGTAILRAARDWTEAAVGSVKPGEDASRTFSGDGSTVTVSVSRSEDGSLSVTECASFAGGCVGRFDPPNLVFEAIAGELEHGIGGALVLPRKFALPALRLVSGRSADEADNEALRVQVRREVSELVGRRAGWLGRGEF